MILVKLITDWPEWQVIRQTPGRTGIWRNCLFVEDDDFKDCDWVVIYGSVKKREVAFCPQQNVIYVDPEPPSVRTWKPQYLNQFAYVITCHRHLNHKGVLNTQQAQPWHVGLEFQHSGKHKYLNFTQISATNPVMGYDEIKSLQIPPKDRLVSIMTSDKSFTDGHRKRLAFIEVLKKKHGEMVHVYGRGVNDISDKWHALDRYKYHVVIENSVCRDYWTEKLSDCYLAGTYPFYYGCPNLDDYFSRDAFSRIDINDPEKAVSILEKLLDKGLYETSGEALSVARERVLDKYNLFAVLSAFIQEKHTQVGQPKQEVVLTPEGITPLYKSIAKKIVGKKIVNAYYKYRYGAFGYTGE